MNFASSNGHFSISDLLLKDSFDLNPLASFSKIRLYFIPACKTILVLILVNSFKALLHQ